MMCRASKHRAYPSSLPGAVLQRLPRRMRPTAITHSPDGYPTEEPIGALYLLRFIPDRNADLPGTLLLIIWMRDINAKMHV